MELKRSNDRKVANSLTVSGNSRIANTFGLPAGREYSCPGATSICSKICYAGRLEKAYPTVMKNLVHNWGLLQHAKRDTMINLLNSMIIDFERDCDKWSAPKKFRIHWDGDFFNDDYTQAWKHVITHHPDTQFWAYTRVESAMDILHGLPNLTIYYSGDSANLSVAKAQISQGRLVAMLGDTFAEAKEALGSRAAVCPEQRKQIPLTGACVACNICPKGTTNITFSITKR